MTGHQIQFRTIIPSRYIYTRLVRGRRSVSVRGRVAALSGRRPARRRSPLAPHHSARSRSDGSSHSLSSGPSVSAAPPSHSLCIGADELFGGGSVSSSHAGSLAPPSSLSARWRRPSVRPARTGSFLLTRRLKTTDWSENTVRAPTLSGHTLPRSASRSRRCAGRRGELGRAVWRHV